MNCSPKTEMRLSLRAVPRLAIAAASAFALLVCGCGGGAKMPSPPASPIATAATVPTATSVRPTPPSAETVPNTPTAAAVGVSEEIRRACGLGVDEAFFAFDSAKLRPGDIAILDKIAECFLRGPLTGRNMKLVGHADPRGDNDYNLALGQRRGDAVKGYFTGHGLGGPRCESSSRGAMDAKGTDEATWANDRRVDMLLSP